MRLLRLLAAGKSLVGSKPGAGRYRPAPPKSLPVFESVPSPFRATATPQGGTPADACASKASTGAGPSERVAGVDVQTAESGTMQPPAVPVQNRAATSHASACPEVKSYRSGGGLNKWFRWRPFGKPADTSGVPRTPPAIQGELSLDNVRPIRNDLGDSDFEVVPAKGLGTEKRTKAERAGVAIARETQSGPGESSPGRGERFSKIRKMVLSAK
jgi:hypothetical protein